MRAHKPKPLNESRRCINDLTRTGQRTRIPLPLLSLPLPRPVTSPRSFPLATVVPLLPVIVSSSPLCSPSPSRHRLLLPALLSLSFPLSPLLAVTRPMLHRLVMASIGNHPNVAYVKEKAFVVKMLREFPSREPVRHVFNRAFKTSLRTVKERLEKYLSPDFRGDHDETEAIRRLNLHSAVHDGKDLLWLLEKMTELRIADTALKEWSE